MADHECKHTEKIISLEKDNEVLMNEREQMNATLGIDEE